jgi:hypothetical protein
MGVKVNGTAVAEVGCMIDGSHGSVEGLNTRTALLADDLLGGDRYSEAHKLAATINADDAASDQVGDAAQALSELADEAISALNDATEGGYWEVDESSVFLRDNDDEGDEG